MPRDDKRPKQLVIARPGKIFLQADYGQCEFRMWANYAQDPQMLVDLRKGFDIHKIGAGFKKGIEIPLDATYEEYSHLISGISKQERQDAKKIIFGIMYGMGAKKAALDLGIAQEDAELIIKKFFTRYPLAKQWLDDQIYKAKADGYVVSAIGRRRRLTKIWDSEDGIRMGAEREAMNSPIQGMASDLNCHVANTLALRFKELKLNGALRILVHDALLYEVPISEVGDILKLFIREMENPSIDCNVPLIAEFEIGTCWGNMEKIEERKR